MSEEPKGRSLTPEEEAELYDYERKQVRADIRAALLAEPDENEEAA